MPKRSKKFPIDTDRAEKASRTSTTSNRLIEAVNVTTLAPSISKSLKRTEHVRVIELRHNLGGFQRNLSDIQHQIDDTWRNILSEVIQNTNSDDIITGYIQHSNLNKDIWLPPRLKKDIQYDEFLNAIGESNNLTENTKCFIFSGRCSIK